MVLRIFCGHNNVRNRNENRRLNAVIVKTPSFPDRNLAHITEEPASENAKNRYTDPLKLSFLFIAISVAFTIDPSKLHTL